MKPLFFVALFITLTFTGCTPPSPTPQPKAPIIYEEPSIEKLSLFRTSMGKVASSIKGDVTYARMNLDTPEKKAWFKNLMFELWDRQITRAEFIEKGLEKYPTHLYEFQFVANGFQKN